VEGPLVGIADGDAVGALFGFSIRKSIGSLVGNAEGYDVGASVGFLLVVYWVYWMDCCW
jgi:hypothetical protein